MPITPFALGGANEEPNYRFFLAAASALICVHQKVMVRIKPKHVDCTLL
jgi:hypothetical protein